MPNFEKELCWKTDSLNQATAVDVANIQYSKIFEAIHFPLTANQRDSNTAKENGTLVTEDLIVEKFKEPCAPDPWHLQPIVGKPGTGKSHLVKSVYEKVKNEPKWNVIYLRKNETGIKNVVEEMLQFSKGEHVERIKKQLSEAHGHLDDERLLEQKLLDSLATFIQVGKDKIFDESGTEIQESKLAKLRDPDKIPALLRNEASRKFFLEEGGVVKRLITNATKGRTEDDGLDDENAYKFTTSDLPDGDYVKGVDTQKILEFIALIDPANKPGKTKRDATLSLINHYVQPAIRELFIGNEIDLTQLFYELRSDFFTRGEELVIFIEEMTVMQGIEKQFLDAVIQTTGDEELKKTKGLKDICPIRVMFAFTDGKLRDLDSFLARVNTPYWMETGFTSSAMEDEDAIDFLGNYLNASRLEISSDSDTSNVGVENYCETCNFTEECHATFETSSKGYGLYPLNRSSALRLIKGSHTDLDQDTFSPRNAIKTFKRVMNFATNEIQHEEFPSDDLVALLGNRPDWNPQIGMKVSEKWSTSRAGNLLQFWANQEPTLNKNDELSISIPEIFSVFKLELDGVVPPPPDPPPPDHPPPDHPPPDHPPPSSETWEDQLTGVYKSLNNKFSSWASGNHLFTTQEALELRKMIGETLLENLKYDTTELNWRSLREKVQPSGGNQTWLKILVQGTAGAKSAQEPYISVEVSDDNAVILRTLLQLKFDDKFSFPSVSEIRRYSQLTTALEKWKSELLNAVEKDTEHEKPKQSIKSLSLLALLSCCLTNSTTSTNYSQELSQNLFKRNVLTESELSVMGDKWQKIYKKISDNQAEYIDDTVAMVGETRGDTNSANVKAHEIEDQINSLIPLLESKKYDALKPPLKQYTKDTVAAIASEWESTVKDSIIDDKFNLDESFYDQALQITKTIKNARNANFLEAELSSLIKPLEDFLDNGLSDGFDQIESFNQLSGEELSLLQKSSYLNPDFKNKITDLRWFSEIVAKCINSIEQELTGSIPETETHLAEGINLLREKMDEVSKKVGAI